MSMMMGVPVVRFGPTAMWSELSVESQGDVAAVATRSWRTR